MKRLVAFTRGGLADRISLALLGRRVAAAAGREFVYIWTAQAGCNCHFDPLFASPDFEVARVQVHRNQAPITQGTLESLVEQVSTASEPVLRLEGFFGHDYTDFPEIFRPSPAVAAAVDDYRQKHFDAPVIGVHVRRTDMSHRDIPADDDYFTVVDRELAALGDAFVFVASDDPQVLENFRLRYDERFLCYPVRTLNRNTPEGVFDALVTLFLLRSTWVVATSLYSGFSLLASWDNRLAPVQTATSPVSHDWNRQSVVIARIRGGLLGDQAK